MKRRGFLVGGGAVASTALVPGISKASTEPNGSNIPSFNSLYRKLRDNHQSFTENDIIHYAMYINADDDAHKCLSAFMMSLDVHNKHLHNGKSTPEAEYIVTRLHKLVVHKLVAIINLNKQLIDGTLELEKERMHNIPYFDGEDSKRYEINWEVD